MFSWVAATLGAAYTLGGRIADAVPLLTQAMAQAMAMDRVIDEALCGLSLGEAYVLAGRLEEAHALAERMLALACERQERGHQAYALHLLGDIAARREPPESALAEAHYQQALTLAGHWGCARFRPTVTVASARYMPRQVGQNRPAPRCPLRPRYTVPWTWPSGCLKLRRRWRRWRVGDGFYDMLDQVIDLLKGSRHRIRC